MKEYLKRLDLLQILTGIVILAIWSLMVATLLFRELPEGNREIIIHMIGILEGAAIGLINYYFGSSKGSQDKNALLNKQNDVK